MNRLVLQRHVEATEDGEAGEETDGRHARVTDRQHDETSPERDDQRERRPIDEGRSPDLRMLELITCH